MPGPTPTADADADEDARRPDLEESLDLVLLERWPSSTTTTARGATTRTPPAVARGPGADTDRHHRARGGGPVRDRRIRVPVVLLGAQAGAARRPGHHGLPRLLDLIGPGARRPGEAPPAGVELQRGAMEHHVAARARSRPAPYPHHRRHRVGIGDRRRGQPAASSAAAPGSSASTCTTPRSSADLSGPDGRAAAVAAVTELAGSRLDGLVVCAGLGPQTRPTDSDHERELLRRPGRARRHAAPPGRGRGARRGGRVVELGRPHPRARGAARRCWPTATRTRRRPARRRSTAPRSTA